MNRLWIPLLLAASLALGACSPKATPATPQSAPATGESKPGPVPPVAVPLPVTPAEQVLSRVQLKPGEPLPGIGIYFTNLDTGATEGWTGEHLSVQPAPGSSRWVLMDQQGRSYLVDRRTGKGWRWESPEVNLVAAGNERVLFEVRASPVTSYVITGPDLAPISTFTGNAGSEFSRAAARFSPDGKQLLVRGHDGSLRLVDTATGADKPVGRNGKDIAGYTTSLGILSLSPDGKEIRVITHHSAAKEWRPELYADIQRFDWNGKEVSPLLTVPGLNPSLSPDGKWVAYDTMYQGKMLTAVIADARTGEPRAWARSAAMCYEAGGSLGQRWLGNSGVVVRTREGYRVLGLDGRFTNQQWNTPGAEPVPSPHNPGLIALRDRTVVDAAGKVVLPARRSAKGIGDSINPWSDDPRELITGVPQYGHGSRCGFLMLLPPVAEGAGQARFDSPVVLEANTPGDCLNVRAAPGGKAVACVPHGTKLTLVPGKDAQPHLVVEQQLIDDAYWLPVKTATGEEGWIAFKAEFLRWPR